MVRMTSPAIVPVAVVRVSPDGYPFTTSADIAALFGKRHSDVLQAIDRLVDRLQELESCGPCDPETGTVTGWGREPECASMAPPDLFELTEMAVPLGHGATRRDRLYNVSRDGCALLSMGFTGSESLASKLAYLKAFNDMDVRLRGIYIAPLPSDKEFTRSMRMKDKLVLHDQARKASRALTDARTNDERRQAYWQLYQINTALGIRMPSMSTLNVMPLIPTDD